MFLLDEIQCMYLGGNATQAVLNLSHGSHQKVPKMCSIIIFTKLDFLSNRFLHYEGIDNFSSLWELLGILQFEAAEVNKIS